jgi:hypothetical protein
MHYEYQNNTWTNMYNYHNPSLRLSTKARACEGAGQEQAQESHFMLPGV